MTSDLHVYKNGYSVLPALQKFVGCPFSGNKVLIQERKAAAKNQKVFFESDIDQATYDPICRYIANETNQSLNGFRHLAENLAEDVVIHRIKDGKDWMAAGHICMPSGWWPEEKIGRPLEEIHKPVPGMRNNHFKLVEAMIHSGPFLRYVWSIVFENKYNYHPSLPKKKFNPVLLNSTFIKVEEQITVGFPEVNATLFILRQNLIQPEEIDYLGLYQACMNMDDAQKAYKEVTPELLEHLKHLATIETIVNSETIQ
jgi:hypothetical protein